MEEKMFTDDHMPISKEFLVQNGFHGQDDYYAIADLSKADSFWSIRIIFASEQPTYITQIKIENADGNNVISIDMSTIVVKYIMFMNCSMQSQCVILI